MRQPLDEVDSGHGIGRDIDDFVSIISGMWILHHLVRGQDSTFRVP